MPKRNSQPKSKTAVNKAISYARVSSKEQDKEGFSIAAQQKLISSYASTNGLVVDKEFIDVETAKHSGRTNFEAMVQHLKKHTEIRIVLVEKTDRLYRNLKDWVTLDELDIEIHLVKEGVILSGESKSSEKFVHGIKVLMAKNYIDNLSEEARKGQQEKAEQGIWPTKAPLGYRNVVGPDGKRIIAVDSTVAPIVSSLFAWYATGTMSLEEVAEKARGAGLTYRRTGAAVPKSAVHTVLRNRIYTGEFEWKGKIYEGRHEPLVSREIWERVQEVIDGRNLSKTRHFKHDFAFSSLIKCGHCGCAMVGERKKGRYVYYHCTGYKGKCPERYVREEVIAEKFSELLGGLQLPPKQLEWMTAGLRESHADEKREHDAAVARLQAEYNRLQHRLHAMYVDKLDGRIDGVMFDQVSSEWRKEQDRCLREISWHQNADQSYLNQGAELLELASAAQRMFARKEPLEKRRLLNFVVSNSTWKDGELHTQLLQPFDMIAETTVLIAQAARRGEAISAERPEWLGD